MSRLDHFTTLTLVTCLAPVPSPVSPFQNLHPHHPITLFHPTTTHHIVTLYLPLPHTSPHLTTPHHTAPHSTPLLISHPHSQALSHARQFTASHERQQNVLLKILKLLCLNGTVAELTFSFLCVLFSYSIL
ncbi:hypothetical protein E2C01_099252 [Portunus trituberculatus]|uniref:Uncharacterized protein n=1 Tax=Portunus trituberculatus TaxID=210409 RepID=A0A5B7K948_PORTR|nr:hypothetical protein [Portunus trituberculatus]